MFAVLSSATTATTSSGSSSGGGANGVDGATVPPSWKPHLPSLRRTREGGATQTAGPLSRGLAAFATASAVLTVTAVAAAVTYHAYYITIAIRKSRRTRPNQGPLNGLRSIGNHNLHQIRKMEKRGEDEKREGVMWHAEGAVNTALPPREAISTALWDSEEQRRTPSPSPPPPLLRPSGREMTDASGDGGCTPTTAAPAAASSSPKDDDEGATIAAVVEGNIGNSSPSPVPITTTIVTTTTNTTAAVAAVASKTNVLLSNYYDLAPYAQNGMPAGAHGWTRVFGLLAPSPVASAGGRRRGAASEGEEQRQASAVGVAAARHGSTTATTSTSREKPMGEESDTGGEEEDVEAERYTAQVAAATNQLVISGRRGHHHHHGGGGSRLQPSRTRTFEGGAATSFEYPTLLRDGQAAAPRMAATSPPSNALHSDCRSGVVSDVSVRSGSSTSGWSSTSYAIDPALHGISEMPHLQRSGRLSVSASQNTSACMTSSHLLYAGPNHSSFQEEQQQPPRRGSQLRNPCGSAAPALSYQALLHLASPNSRNISLGTGSASSFISGAAGRSSHVRGHVGEPDVSTATFSPAALAQAQRNLQRDISTLVATTAAARPSSVPTSSLSVRTSATVSPQLATTQASPRNAGEGGEGDEDMWPTGNGAALSPLAASALGVALAEVAASSFPPASVTTKKTMPVRKHVEVGDRDAVVDDETSTKAGEQEEARKTHAVRSTTAPSVRQAAAVEEIPEASSKQPPDVLQSFLSPQQQPRTLVGAFGEPFSPTTTARRRTIAQQLEVLTSRRERQHRLSQQVQLYHHPQEQQQSLPQDEERERASKQRHGRHGHNARPAGASHSLPFYKLSMDGTAEGTQAAAAPALVPSMVGVAGAAAPAGYSHTDTPPGIFYSSLLRPYHDHDHHVYSDVTTEVQQEQRLRRKDHHLRPQQQGREMDEEIQTSMMNEEEVEGGVSQYGDGRKQCNLEETEEKDMQRATTGRVVRAHIVGAEPGPAMELVAAENCRILLMPAQPASSQDPNGSLSNVPWSLDAPPTAAAAAHAIRRSMNDSYTSSGTTTTATTNQKMKSPMPGSHHHEMHTHSGTSTSSGAVVSHGAVPVTATVSIPSPATAVTTTTSGALTATLQKSAEPPHDRRVDDLTVKQQTDGSASYSISLTYHDSATGTSRTVNATALPPLRRSEHPSTSASVSNLPGMGSLSASMLPMVPLAAAAAKMSRPTPLVRPGSLGRPSLSSSPSRDFASAVRTPLDGTATGAAEAVTPPCSSSPLHRALVTASSRSNGAPAERVVSDGVSSGNSNPSGRRGFAAPLPPTEPPHGPRLQGVAGRNGEMAIGAFLGGGACGKVYECLNTETGQVLAAKQIVFDAKDRKLRTRLKQLELELEVLTLAAKHRVQWIVGFYGAEKRGHSVLMYLEYCQRGSLLDYMAEGNSADIAVWGDLGSADGLRKPDGGGVPGSTILPTSLAAFSYSSTTTMTMTTTTTESTDGAGPTLTSHTGVRSMGMSDAAGATSAAEDASTESPMEPPASAVDPWRHTEAGDGAANCRVTDSTLRGLRAAHHRSLSRAVPVAVTSGGGGVEGKTMAEEANRHGAQDAETATAAAPLVSIEADEVVLRGSIVSSTSSISATFSGSTWDTMPLNEALHPQMPPLSIRQVQCFTRQIVEGLRFMHEHHYAHLDVKTANVLITAEEECRLADLGCAMRLQSASGGTVEGVPVVSTTEFTGCSDPDPCTASTRSTPLPYAVLVDHGAITELRGTALYMAPEMIRFESHAIGSPADIWSLGCVVMEMATGCAPWRHIAKDKLRVLYRVGSARKELPLPPLLRAWAEEGTDWLDMDAPSPTMEPRISDAGAAAAAALRVAGVMDEEDSKSSAAEGRGHRQREWREKAQDTADSEQPHTRRRRLDANMVGTDVSAEQLTAPPAISEEGTMDATAVEEADLVCGQRRLMRLYVELCNFIAACMKVRPEDRSTAEELLRHPFLNL